jgi:hypothetical protein
MFLFCPISTKISLVTHFNLQKMEFWEIVVWLNQLDTLQSQVLCGVIGGNYFLIAMGESFQTEGLAWV